MLVVDRCYRRPRTRSSTNLETRRGRYAAQKLPANVDVAVALSLAGVGLIAHSTRYGPVRAGSSCRKAARSSARPEVTAITHVIAVEADSTKFEIKIQGTPTAARARNSPMPCVRVRVRVCVRALSAES